MQQIEFNPKTQDSIKPWGWALKMFLFKILCITAMHLITNECSFTILLQLFTETLECTN